MMLGIPFLAEDFGEVPQKDNREVWRTIFSYKHVWMAWVGVIYYGKCNDFILINCVRHCIRGDFI